MPVLQLLKRCLQMPIFNSKVFVSFVVCTCLSHPIIIVDISWCERGDLNSHRYNLPDPKSSASTNSATLATKAHYIQKLKNIKHSLAILHIIRPLHNKHLPCNISFSIGRANFCRTNRLALQILIFKSCKPFGFCESVYHAVVS